MRLLQVQIKDNQTYSQVPYTLDDAHSIKQFLIRTAEQIDIIKGNKVSDSSEESTDTSLGSLETATTELSTSVNTIEDIIKTIENDIATINDTIEELMYVMTPLALDSSYEDFDAIEWSTHFGRGQRSMLGSNMVNAPITPIPATTYKVYSSSFKTLGGGVIQEVIIQNGAISVDIFRRSGDTWAACKTNGWDAIT